MLFHADGLLSGADAHVFEPLIDSWAARLLGDIHIKTLQRYARRATFLVIKLERSGRPARRSGFSDGEIIRQTAGAIGRWLWAP
jgi:hypothetical protein